MKKKLPEEKNTSTVHFRLSEEDIAMLDCCAQIAGLSRSAYVRKIALSHIRSEMAEKSISNTEKIIRETMETILDIKTKNEAKTLRRLIGEIQRANFMQLKNYIELNPDLDFSEYQAYYYQCEKEAYELSSGKRVLENILHMDPLPKEHSESVQNETDALPDWLKVLSENT